MRRIVTCYRRRVADRRNSMCGSSALHRLDFSRWFTDGPDGRLYLHVAGPDDTWHRVWCRHTNSPRLKMDDGVLYWLIDLPREYVQRQIDAQAAGK